MVFLLLFVLQYEIITLLLISQTICNRSILNALYLRLNIKTLAIMYNIYVQMWTHFYKELNNFLETTYDNKITMCQIIIFI